MSTTIVEEEYKNGLKMRLYLPPTTTTDNDDDALRPAILDIHGGTWTHKDRTLDQVCNKALAAEGFVVAAIDFRLGPTHQHPAASQDIVSALRWLRDDENASRFRIDTEKVGVLGTSSGGHLALLAGIVTNAYNNNGDDPVAPPKFIIALWPVSCPLQRFRYAKRAKRDDLIRCQEGFFGTEDSMREASVPRKLMSGQAESLPPLLLVVPGEDANVPLEINLDLLESWQKCDAHLEYAYFPGQPHAFGLREGPETDRMNNVIIDFAKRAQAM